MNKFTELMESKLFEFQIIEDEDGEEMERWTFRWKHFVTVILIMIALALLQGCSGTRNAAGERWRAKQVWMRVTASKDTTGPIRIGGWSFPPGTIEFILWRRLDSLQRRIEILEAAPTNALKTNPFPNVGPL